MSDWNVTHQGVGWVLWGSKYRGSLLFTMEYKGNQTTNLLGNLIIYLDLFLFYIYPYIFGDLEGLIRLRIWDNLNFFLLEFKNSKGLTIERNMVCVGCKIVRRFMKWKKWIIVFILSLTMCEILLKINNVVDLLGTRDTWLTY